MLRNNRLKDKQRRGREEKEKMATVVRSRKWLDPSKVTDIIGRSLGMNDVTLIKKNTRKISSTATKSLRLTRQKTAS